jgi:PadR family transcriptional regulator, regulatory protein PadR
MPRSEHLSDFEFYVMLAVAALDDEAYGVSIATRINDRTGRDVSIGAVYATLGRLADKRFVSFRVSEPEPVRGGRARKLVSLTPAGMRALRRTTDELARMLEGTPLRPMIGARQ